MSFIGIPPTCAIFGCVTDELGECSAQSQKRNSPSSSSPSDYSTNNGEINKHLKQRKIYARHDDDHPSLPEERETRILNEAHIVDVVFLDYANAFDFVYHQFLLSKYKSVCINGNVLNWIKYFLSGVQGSLTIILITLL